MGDFKRTLVTSALPYANGPLHIGQIAGAYLPGDIFVRYSRLKGDEIIYICGTDEYGVPITISAEKSGTTPQAVVDHYYPLIKKSFEDFGISFDNFSRTSLPVHTETAQDFFTKFMEKGYLVKRESEQWFDTEKKMFLPDRYVTGTCPQCGSDDAKGDQCEVCGKWYDSIELKNPVSQLSGKTPELKKTWHWYMKFGDFQERLKEFIESHSHWKANVINYCRGWLEEGLEERAVTRDLDWGIPVPLDDAEGKKIYVWFEAVLGYISSTKEWAQKQGDPGLWEKYWKSDDTRLIHFIGKDNIYFHALMFPAMLMGYGGYVLEDNIPANEFLNLKGSKLSTSKNHAVWLHEYLQNFSPDPLRYALAANAPEGKDSDFTWAEFQSKNNNELADILGNFVHRTVTFVHKYFEGKVPPSSELSESDKKLILQLKESTQIVGEAYGEFRVKDAVKGWMNLARSGNKYFNENEPWVTLKSDPERCSTAINHAVQTIKTLAVLASPVIPFTSEKIWSMLNLDMEISWSEAGHVDIDAGHKLNEPTILFRKIEDEQIEAEESKLSDENSSGGEAGSSGTDNLITVETVKSLGLKIATVTDAEKIAGTDKLLKLIVSLGDEKRQIVAGVAADYEPEDIKGKRIVVVTNLKPATIRGEKSEGMLLAAESDKGFSLLTVEGEPPDGASIS